MLPSGRHHSIMTQESIDHRFASAKGDKRLQRRAASTHRQNLIAKSCAGIRIYHLAAMTFLKKTVGVGRQYFRPLIAVIAGGVAAAENM